MKIDSKTSAVTSNLQTAQRRTMLGLLVLAGLGVAFSTMTWASSEGRAIPPFAAAAPASPPSNTAGLETAVIAGGCFWGVQGVFQHVKGVTNAVSGYAGGDKKTAVYELIGTGMTGHAEAVQVTYDPKQISYARILQIYFSVAHDPTQLNRQGPDRGTQYRSAIFPANDAQANVAKAYIAQLTQAKTFDAAIVTKLEPGHTFYPAEEYHQDFLVRNPTYPYIVVNDLPKIGDLRRIFPEAFREEPALVLAAKRKAG